LQWDSGHDKLYAPYIMPWYSKEQPTPFDTTPIAGLQFLHGDVMAERYAQEHTAGKKYPLITFPSGIERELCEGGGVHLFGTLELPVSGSRDEAHDHILPLAEEYDYQIGRHGKHGLVVANPYARSGYTVTYDRTGRKLADITRFPQEAMELLPGEIRAALPPLYHNEKQGLKAVAPVKFFTPDAGWTWYATEFDGDDLFFGLVSGLEIELGYFALTELEGVRGPMGLPIDRDLYYDPQPLEQLQAYEQRLRGG
jgi:hypothetical protein